MSDETTPAAESNTAIAEGAPEAEKLEQIVEVSDVGPCKKHIKVTIDRTAIDQRFNEKYTELVRSDTSQLNGFRPGKAPRKIIERRFKSTVEEQVRSEVLMASLEQLATENKIAPLSPPDLNPATLNIPDNGPFIYEFDIEVRPEFDLPSYKGLTLKRPVKTFTPAEIEKEKRRLLEPSGQIIPKAGDAKVEMGDIIVADVVISMNGRDVNHLKEVRVKVEKQLALTDGLAEDFGNTVVGAKSGDERDVTVKMSESIDNAALRGKELNARFKINDVKTVRLPELTPELLREFGVRNEDQFEELIGAALERRLEYLQRQAFRQQVLAQLADASKWELPRDLLVRQAERALGRRMMEMRSAGMSPEEILGRRRVLEQDIVQSTAMALREHFVLQKIAELEKIDVEDDDIDGEIERIAARSDESPRKVRARLEKDDLIESLATELLERRALDLVLENAVYEDFELKDEDDEGEVAMVSDQAAPASSEAGPSEY